MTERRIIMATTAKPIVILVVIAVLLSLPVITVAGQAGGGLTNETLTVPFENGDVGVQTVNSYSGRVLVKVRGTGQAAGTAWSDAFYLFTDGEGNPVEPWHIPEGYNFALWINGGPADAFVDPILPYNPDHVYVFQIDVPEGPLTFAVGDCYTVDNSGEYQIVVRDLPH
jgi:hypothetical protein